MKNKTVSTQWSLPTITAGERLFSNFYPLSDSSDDEEEGEGKRLVKRDVLERETLWENINDL